MGKRRRHKHHNDCRSKVRFGSREEAQRDQPAQVPYLCAKCSCWHLTSLGRRR